jgi:hypothetical protein
MKGQEMLKSRLHRGAVALLAATPLLVASSADAMTVSGRAGGFHEGGTTCYVNPSYPSRNRVIVQPPVMSSSPVSNNGTVTVGGGLYGGGNHVQTVGYRAFLYRWNGATWSYTGAYGALHRGSTGDVLQPVLWTTGLNGGSTVFNTPSRGFYRVFLRAYWFADALAGGGTAQGWSGLYEQGRQSYCRF